MSDTNPEVTPMSDLSDDELVQAAFDHIREKDAEAGVVASFVTPANVVEVAQAMASDPAEAEAVANQALEDALADEEGPKQPEPTLDLLLEGLSEASRRTRQNTAHEIAEIAKVRPQMLLDKVDVLVDAVGRPEAQTRWEVLNALTAIATLDPAACTGAIDAAETALFDEGSSMVRLAGFRLLIAEGLSTPELASQVWPLLDEAIQCYHGDPEYRNMLTALVEFAAGPAPQDVREALASRVAFDSEKSTLPYIRAFSKDIVEACQAPRN